MPSKHTKIWRALPGARQRPLSPVRELLRTGADGWTAQTVLRKGASPRRATSSIAGCVGPAGIAPAVAGTLRAGQLTGEETVRRLEISHLPCTFSIRTTAAKGSVRPFGVFTLVTASWP